MTLMNRFTRLFKADVHAILDNLEEPEQMLKQALRDMQQALSSEQKQLKILELKLSQLEYSNNSNNQLLVKLETELQLCIDANNQSLSKNLIRKKLILQATSDENSRKIEKIIDSIKLQKKSIEEMRQAIIEVTQKVDVISEKKSDNPLHSTTCIEHNISNEDVEIEWLRLQSDSSNKPKSRKAS